jgi:hypothetical protein
MKDQKDVDQRIDTKVKAALEERERKFEEERRLMRAETEQAKQNEEVHQTLNPKLWILRPEP